uniref:DNA mismatch repair proteins mutS family domain-containing protein n=1 Tax=Triticum urartu TaxID=4572 RepID=A0A8R7VCB2_TRIUA
MGNKSMTTEKSTIMIYLHQVGTRLRNATLRSLCLLDRFSTGTLTEDCIGGTIIHFANYGYPPKVLLLTHLPKIFAKNYLPQSERIKCCTMSVLNPDGQTSNKNIISLRLVPGHERLCFGLHCAQLASVPGDDIQRAASVLEDIHPKRPVRRKICYNLAARDWQKQEA